MIYKLDHNFKNTPLGWQKFVFSLPGLEYAANKCYTINGALLKYRATYRLPTQHKYWQVELPAEIEFTEEKCHTMFILKYGILE